MKKNKLKPMAKKIILLLGTMLFIFFVLFGQISFVYAGTCLGKDEDGTPTPYGCSPCVSPQILVTSSGQCIDPPIGVCADYAPASAPAPLTPETCQNQFGVWITTGCTSPKVLKNGACVNPPPSSDLGRCTFLDGRPPLLNVLSTACIGGVWVSNTSINTPRTSIDKTYHFLAPLPCTGDAASGCVDGKLITFDPTGDNKLGAYLNLMIKIFIGISAVLAVIMIVMGGIEYMTTELISGKEEGKKRIQNALLGLLLALGAYTLLNTINPDILKTDLSSLKDAKVDVTIKDFQISGALSRDGKPSKVNFKAEACPAATTAQASTGVDKAFILAIFAQETGGGANTGGCLPANANMFPEDKKALETIVGSNNMNTTYVSCASGGGHGGAIGLMQFRPTTWLANGGSGKNPWNTNDALMIAGVYLKNIGAINDPRNAACKYYSGVACQPGRQPPNEFYGDNVMNRMVQIKAQIAKDGC